VGTGNEFDSSDYLTVLPPPNLDRAPNGQKARPGLPFWERPKAKKDLRWFMQNLGFMLIALGLLMFLFVGYQLWGTGIQEAQSQNRLESSFKNLLAESSVEKPVLGIPSPIREPIFIAQGDAVFFIQMPTINVTKYVVAGVETADLEKGPGHYPSTPLPGELGNSAIAGHRTTYGEPFRHLDDLEIGDPIIITDLFNRTFTYTVTAQQIVKPSDSWVTATTDPNKATLTLTTCDPEFSAKRRLIISAEMDLKSSEIAASPAATYTQSSPAEPSIDNPPPTSEPAVKNPPPQPTFELESDTLSQGWFGDPSAIPHAAMWSLAELLILCGAWQVAKKFRNRLIGVAVGFAPFFVVLYFVFENINRLLPPNL
jgi:sortase A